MGVIAHKFIGCSRFFTDKQSCCGFFYASGVFAAHVRAAGLVDAQSVADGLQSQSD